jgi:hypothetical protein
MAGEASARLSAPVYFISVLLLTLAGFGAAMLARPAFGHAVLQWTGLEPVPRALPGSFYAVRVAPLLRDRCIGCHGETRQKAGLRLDSFAEVMLGSRHGAVIRPGDIRHSELLTRISLPPSDDRAMPPSGKTPLTDDEVTVIRLWIASGASGGLPAGAVKGAPKLVKPVTIPELDPARAARQRAPLAAVVQQVQRRLPGVVDYESRGSADLEVDASLTGDRFGDAELAMLAPLSARIVRANFSGTAVTDASASALAAIVGLERLRLADTRITGATIRALAPLKKLRSLTVTGTKITDEDLASLRQKGVAIYADPDVH